MLLISLFTSLSFNKVPNKSLFDKFKSLFTAICILLYNLLLLNKVFICEFFKYSLYQSKFIK